MGPSRDAIPSDFLEDNAINQIQRINGLNLVSAPTSSYVIVWYSAFFGLCTFTGYQLSRWIFIKEESPSKQLAYLILIPITIIIISTVAYAFAWCDQAVCDVGTAGIVVGIFISVSLTPKPKQSLRLLAHEGDTTREIFFRDFKDIPLDALKSSLAQSFGVQVSQLRFESRKGRLIEETEGISTQDVIDIVSSKAGKEVVATCYIHLVEETVEAAGHLTAHRRASRTSILSSLMPTKMLNLPIQLNLRGDIKRGAPLAFSGKMNNAANASSAFHLACVEDYAAATTKSIDAPMKLYPWCDQNSSLDVDEDGISIAGGRSVASSGNGSETHGGMAADARSLDEPIRNGDVVVIQFNGKFMSLVRGWWFAFNSTSPRRSGAFVLEILEQYSQKTLDKRLIKGMRTTASGMRDMVMMRGGGSTSTGQAAGGAQAQGVHAAASQSPSKDAPAASSSAAAHVVGGAASPGSPDVHIVEKGEILRPGDVFRLRSLKYPEFSFGVTNVRLENDFFYMGLAKVDESASTGWSLPLRFTVKPTSAAAAAPSAGTSATSAP